jgi:hypothetical protein
MSYPIYGNVYLGSINLNYQPKRWFITSTSNNNGSTSAGNNLGSLNGSGSGGYWNTVSVSGGANSSAWNISTAVFTAPEKGQYNIQLNVFINNTSITGRWMDLRGTVSFGMAGANGQYGSFNKSYLTSDNGTDCIFVSYWFNSGETFYINCSNTSPPLYYSNNHTTLTITKIL